MAKFLIEFSEVCTHWYKKEIEAESKEHALELFEEDPDPFKESYGEEIISNGSIDYETINIEEID
jgi:hypothetical protein